MKNERFKKIIKKVWAFVMLISMMVGYLNPLANVKAETTTEYVTFSANWANGEKTYTAESNSNVIISYNLQLSGGPVFSDLVISAEDITEDKTLPAAKIKFSPVQDAKVVSSGHSLQYNNAMISGYSSNANITLTFGRGANFTEYDKKIKVKVTGTYELDGEKGEIENKEEILNIHITPKPDITEFKGNVNYEFYNESQNLAYKNSPIDWKLDNFVFYYNIKLKTQNETFTYITLDVNRTSDQNISKSILNSEENLDIFVLGQEKYERLGYSFNVIRKDDGTAYLKIEKGEQSDEYNNTGLNTLSNTITVGIRYKVIEDINLSTIGKTIVNTKLIANIEGFSRVRNKDGITYKHDSDYYSMSKERSINLWSHVIGTTAANDYNVWIRGIDIDEDTLKQQFETDNKLSVSYNTEVAGLIGLKNVEDSDKLRIYSQKGSQQPYVTYKNGENENDVILDDEMTLNRIKVNNIDKIVDKIEFFKINDVYGEATPFFTAKFSGDEYIVPEGENLTDYYAVVSGFFDAYNNWVDLVDWVSDWNVDLNALKSKMSEENINNIRKITRYQNSKYVKFGQRLSGDCQDSASVNVDFSVDHIMSYADIGVNTTGDNSVNYNGSVSTYLGMEHNKKITIGFGDYNSYADTTIKNVEPKLFIQVPDAYEYYLKDGSATLSSEANGKMYVKSCYMEKISGKQFIVVELAGTYDAKTMRGMKLTINHDRRLIEENPNHNQYLKLYMITDNEGYARGRTYNTYGFEKQDGYKPEYVMITSTNFEISKSDTVKTNTGICYKDSKGREKIYRPGRYSDGTYSPSSKSQPVKIETNSNVKYKTSIESISSKLKDIDLIMRLPQQDNMSITTENSLSSTMSLTGLDKDNIVVYEQKGIRKKSIPSTNYTILASTDLNANFGSTFIPIDEITDASTIKTLKIKFNENYELSDNTLYVEYTMIMPEAEGISGATNAIQYREGNSETLQTLESTAAYVENGNPKGTINLVKKFEGVENGAPAGVSLSGIQFKFKDVDTDEYLEINGQTVFTTDAQGKIQITDVPEGLYKVEELTTFDNYDRIDYINILVEQGTVSPDPVVVENKLKRGTLEIEKQWTDAQGQPDEEEIVTFKITRNDGFTYEATADVDPQSNIATFIGVPYGTYTVSEETDYYGWYFSTANPTVTLSKQNEAYDADNNVVPFTFTGTNDKSIGTIIIDKTMPFNDDVREMTFKITCTDGISYVDTQGNNVKLDTDIELNVGDYYTNPQNGITVELNNTEDPTKAPTHATITIPNLPMGTYTVKEINMPQVSNATATRYYPVTQRVSLVHNGDSKTVEITNNWRKNTLKIVKEAATGVDLTQFKVRVKLEESDYDTTYDKTFNFPASGQLVIPDLYLGKYSITELESDYYEPLYGASRSDLGEQPYIVEVKSNQITTAFIYNENTYGKVKILKTLEDKTADQAIGIKFRIHGKDATGANDVDELIEITGTEEIEGTLYGVGISNSIQAGGDYELEEVTKLEDYKDFTPISVDIKKQYANDPLVIKVDNKRKRGNLEITTKTIPEGGPLSPIEYRVTAVEIDSDYKVTEVEGTSKSLTGIAGYAELKNIYAGTYKVELTKVPTGYEEDLPQIVEVPEDGTGYAQFEIEKPELINTNVKIEKEIITKDGNIATSSDFTSAMLSENERFEAIISSADTGKIYYIFFNQNEAGQLKGLPDGTYRIDEVYKPKYLATKYYIKNEDEYEEFDKTFVIDETNRNFTIKIQNTINTDFGFGGQDSKENFSLTTNAQVNKVTKTIILVSDEDGNVPTGAKLKIYDDRNREVPIAFEDNTYVVGTDKKLIVNGLPVGTYTVRVIEVPDGYDKDREVSREFTVYEGATMVTRTEIWTDRPTGSLLLRTPITDENGNKVTDNNGKTVCAPRSKYKMYDPITGKTLKFVKTASGNYERSKLDTATDTISLRAGQVEVTGIEVGNYELGLVDLSENYGVIKEEVEKITIADDQTVNCEVLVKERGGFVKVASNGSRTVALTEDGKLYTTNTSSDYEDYPYEIYELDNIYSELKNINVKDFAYSKSGNVILIVDNQGKVWTNGTGYEDSTKEYTDYLTCISEIENHPFNGLKIEKVFVAYGSDLHFYTCFAIDENGQLWLWGYPEVYLKPYDAVYKTPINISDNDLLRNVEIIDVSCAKHSLAYLLDKNGNLYAMGRGDEVLEKNVYDKINSEDSNGIICLTNTDGYSLNSVKIKSLATDSNSYGDAYFIDYDGNLWYSEAALSWSNEYGKNPVCLTKEPSNPLYNKTITDVDIADVSQVVTAIDSDGKLWSWGKNRTYQKSLGTNEPSSSDVPICISDLEENDLDTVRLKQVRSPENSRNGCAIDENGDLWLWGYSSVDYNYSFGYRTRSIFNGSLPQKIRTTRESTFDLFEVDKISISNSNSIVQDKSGKLWVLGDKTELLYDYNNKLSSYNSRELGSFLEEITVKDFVAGGKNAVIIDTDDRLWTIGSLNFIFVENDTGNDSFGVEEGTNEMKPVCVTERKDSVLYNKKIQFATANDTTIAVIDSEGKLYTAGSGEYSGTNSSAYNLGYPLQDSLGKWNNNVSKYNCVNDANPELQDIKFKSVSIFTTDVMHAIDTDGNVWVWGKYNTSYNGVYGIDLDSAETYTDENITYIKPTKLTFPVIGDNSEAEKIVDVKTGGAGGIALSQNGNIYSWGYNIGWYRGQQPMPIKTPAQEGVGTIMEGKNIVKIGAGAGGLLYALDDSGNVYQIATGNVNNYSQSVGFVAVDFYTGPSSFLVKDDNGDIWGLGGSALGLDNTNWTWLTKPIENNIYGKTVTSIFTSSTFGVQNGEDEDLYSISNIGETKKSHTIKQYLNGISISKEGYIYNNTSRLTSSITFDKLLYVDDNVYFALATNGKLYKGGKSGSPYLVNGLGTGNIEKVWAKSYEKTVSGNTAKYVTFYVQDEDNRLFYCAETRVAGAVNATAVTEITGMLVSGATPKFKEIDFIYGLDEYDNLWDLSTKQIIRQNVSKYFNINDRVFAVLDTSGNVWTWGKNTFGSLGTGDTEDRTEPTLVLGEVDRVTDLCVVDHGYRSSTARMYAITESGYLYTWGTLHPSYNSDIYTAKVCVANDVEGAQILEASGQVSRGYNGSYLKVKKADETIVQYWVPDVVLQEVEIVPIEDPAPTDIVATSGDTKEEGTLILKTDGKLYRTENKKTVCISDKEIIVPVLGKHFELVRDSKYNN